MEDHEIYWEAALYILIALLVAIAGLYFLLQTAGEQNISAHGFPRIATIIWLRGDGSPFFRAISYRAGERQFGRDGQPATLVAKSVDIALTVGN